MMMQSKPLNENIKYNDLVDLILDTFSIDQYKSKIGDDANIVVVAFKVMDSDPAQDLSQFLETGHESALDVDVSPGPDEEGNYTVFIEFDRNSKLYDTIVSVLEDVQRVNNAIASFKFTSYEEALPVKWSRENFEKNVISSSYDYTIKHNPDAKQISERMKFLNKY
jgi:hypothetical protein